MRVPSKTTLLLVASLAQAYPHSPSDHPKVIHILRNTAENAIISLPISGDGTLGKGHFTLTAGQGGTALNGPGQPSGPDALFSQAPLAIAGDLIFALNPGSNTLSILKPNSDDPTSLTLFNDPVSVPGSFPNTVAASPKHSLVCVGTTGTKAGISCAPFNDHGLIAPFDALRPYNLNQTTPPVGPPNTVSQAFFSDDESRLYVTVKGIPNTDNNGFLSVFPVLNGGEGCRANKTDPESSGKARLGRHDTRSSFASAPLLFGAAVIPSNQHSESDRVLVTDPTLGAVILDVNPDTNVATLTTPINITNQQATCWAAYSSQRNSVFVTDVLVNNLVELDAKNGTVIANTLLPNSNPGYIDLAVAGRFVYALSPGNGTTEAAVVVFDPVDGKQVQEVGIGAYGGDRNAVGVVVGY
ncbi:hypothetical protein BJY04DRAFT_216684 [Aspergillus karnatakaensis]|uniref:YncE family protein n=1 Tax=Aspergillus karnatakaensis TaxID=1810916 RepID=UPI003CCDF0D7